MPTPQEFEAKSPGTLNAGSAFNTQAQLRFSRSRLTHQNLHHLSFLPFLRFVTKYFCKKTRFLTARASRTIYLNCTFGARMPTLQEFEAQEPGAFNAGSFQILGDKPTLM
jgi:hypothetical protein